MKIKLPIFIILFSLTSFSSFAQNNVIKCGINLAEEQAELLFPGLQEQIYQNTLEFNEYVEQFVSQRSEEDALYTVPVVFHIIYDDDISNISNSKIYEEMEIINQDFNALNPDFGNAVPEFDGRKADVQIQFKLAQYDPQGNCTSGITRTFSTLTNQGNQSMKELIQWPRNKYLNIWICRSISGGGSGTILGYTFKPISFIGANPLPASYDGIVAISSNIGNNASFGGRTVTHEIGHWIGLDHPWGGGEIGFCGNDFVSDTPTTEGQAFGCNLSAVTCGSLDNVQNYMNYADCPMMYTNGQKARMQASIESSAAQRNQLWTESNLTFTGVLDDPILCAANFSSNSNIACLGSTITFTDESFNGITERTWVFEGGDPATSTDSIVEVTYNESGHFNVTLTVGNGTDEVSSTETEFIFVLSNDVSPPYNEIFDNTVQFPDSNWFIESGNNTFWEITDNAAAVGTKSAFLDNRFQNDGETDILTSSTVDLSNVSDVMVSFKFAFAKRHDNDVDRLRFKISRNCGDTWVQKKTLRANTNTLVTAPRTFSNFVPDADEWGETVVTNIESIYFISNFRFQFEFTNGSGNNVYIDDIKIFDPTVTGINEVDKKVLNFGIYPNPVENELNINFNLLKQTAVIAELYDVTGRKIETIFDNNFSLGTHRVNYNLSGLKQGVYMIRLTLENESFTKRVIKN